MWTDLEPKLRNRSHRVKTLCICSVWTSPNTYEYDTATHDNPPKVTAAKPPGSVVRRAVHSSLPVSMLCRTSLYESLLAAAHSTTFPSGSTHMSLTEVCEVLMFPVTEKSKSTKILQYKTTHILHSASVYNHLVNKSCLSIYFTLRGDSDQSTTDAKCKWTPMKNFR